MNQYEVDQPNLIIALVMDGVTLNDDTIVGDLDHHRDQIVVLRAIKQTTGDMERLNPTTTMYRPEISHGYPPPSSTVSPSPSRAPLQPVVRQMNTLSQQSLSDAKPVKRENSQETATQPVSDRKHLGQNDFLHHLENRNPLTGSPSAAARVENEPAAIADVEMDTIVEPEPDTVETQHYKPRELSDPFAIGEDEGFFSAARGQPLRELAQDSAPERLEAGVRIGVELLSKLREPLKQLNDHADAENWLAQIEKIRNDAVQTRTVVGVVGNTGSGKSSIINAMLDEERLVPTNCMRACTAVVTELSYNHSKSETSRYRAEVEFIQPEDWRKELEILCEEIFDEKGALVSDARNPDSQAGIAYAKIRAVYHRYTKEMLAKATVETLMQVKSVRSVLGTSKRINERRPDTFYKRLQHYVDSREKGDEKLDKNGKKLTNPKREFEFWPLIKVVKIYTKADALSTGAVIVDLPGVHDSNAARAAVAEGYMKQCTGLWIVAPINRAVDDKAAKTLLGNTFKREYKACLKPQLITRSLT